MGISGSCIVKRILMLLVIIYLIGIKYSGRQFAQIVLQFLAGDLQFSKKKLEILEATVYHKMTRDVSL